MLPLVSASVAYPLRVRRVLEKREGAATRDKTLAVWESMGEWGWCDALLLRAQWKVATFSFREIYNFSKIEKLQKLSTTETQQVTLTVSLLQWLLSPPQPLPWSSMPLMT